MGSFCSKLSLDSLCSKSSNYQGGHVVLSDTTNGANAAKNASDPPPRELALAAAERRAKEAQSRGVHESNPKRGKLSEQLANQNRGLAPETQMPERIIFD